MKKLAFACVFAGVAAGFAQGGETVRPGDEGLKRETSPAPLVSVDPDRPQPTETVSWTPFAVNFC